MDIMTSETSNRLVENIVAMVGGGSGGTIAWLTFGGWIEAIGVAAACTISGLLIKELYNFCKRRIRNERKRKNEDS